MGGGHVKGIWRKISQKIGKVKRKSALLARKIENF
jgi:hypothetical protein